MSRQKLTEAERFWAKVNKTDGCWHWTGGKNQGYGVFSSTNTPDGSRKFIRAHRYSWMAVNGTISSDVWLDHLCHNPSCVRPDHLRPTTPKQNGEHRKGPTSLNTSGALGVTQRRNRFHASTKHEGQIYRAGYYDTPEEAELAVRKLRLGLFTHNDVDPIELARVGESLRLRRRAEVLASIVELRAAVA